MFCLIGDVEFSSEEMQWHESIHIYTMISMQPWIHCLVCEDMKETITNACGHWTAPSCGAKTPPRSASWSPGTLSCQASTRPSAGRLSRPGHPQFDRVMSHLYIMYRLCYLTFHVPLGLIFIAMHVLWCYRITNFANFRLCPCMYVMWPHL
jgi:hypothetical protein